MCKKYKLTHKNKGVSIKNLSYCVRAVEKKLKKKVEKSRKKSAFSVIGYNADGIPIKKSIFFFAVGYIFGTFLAVAFL